MNELTKRCSLICGEDTRGCFIKNANHYDCITDIVINKVWAAREIIELQAGENTCAQTERALKIATREMDDLIAWMKQLKTLKNNQPTEENEVIRCTP